MLSIVGYRGDDAAQSTGADPQLIVADTFSTVIDVNVNQANPDTMTTGGVSEFALANPVIALQGSAAADSPNLVLYLDLTSVESVTVSFSLRDIDGSTDNAAQPVVAQFRIGTTGDFTNLPAAFVADASSGPSLAVLTTPVSFMLAAAVNNQAQLQLRILTANAVGNDEWIGVDDIHISGIVAVPEPSALLSMISGIGMLCLLRRRSR